MIKIAIAGCGYWGPNLVRNFYQLDDTRLMKVCDPKKDRLSYIKKTYADIGVTGDYGELLDDKEIDGVVIATNAELHYKMAREALAKGKHVLVEKPLAMNTQDAGELVELAAKNRKVLMVGHTFEYNAAVRKTKEYIQSGEIGDVYYLYSKRLNLGIVRQDVNAWWNLAPHDISIIMYLFGKMPKKVSAKGLTYLQRGIADVVFATLDFDGGLCAHIHVSWLDPNKIRQMTLVGSKKMLVYDDVNPDAKITLFDKGITKKNISDSLGEFDNFGKFQLLHRAGDVVIPRVDFTEPLKTECRHFIECIQKNQRPLTDGENGLRVVRVLEAGQRSIENNGTEVRIDK